MLHTTIRKARDLVQRLKDETGSPGLVIGVSVDGQHVWSQGLGYADLENRLKCTSGTVMRVASVSKAITMAAVAKQWEQGKLDLDKPVQSYVPTFPEKCFQGEHVSVTTRQLVSHTSGIRHYERHDIDADMGTSEDVGLPDDRSEVKRREDDYDRYREYFIKERYDSVSGSLSLFQDSPLLHKPGTSYLYSTHGWTLVSAVLEGATGEKFPSIMKSLFKDIGMTSTYLDEPEPLIYNRARYYVKKRGRIVNAPYIDQSYKWAGEGILSTVGDLLKFANAMLYSFQQKEGDSQSCEQLLGYLKPDTVKSMWNPNFNTRCEWDRDGFYGLGWAIIPNKQEYGFCRHQRYYMSHAGGALGASCVLLILPRSECDGNCGTHPQGVVVAMAVNMVSVRLNKMALEIANLFEHINHTPVTGITDEWAKSKL